MGIFESQHGSDASFVCPPFLHDLPLNGLSHFCWQAAAYSPIKPSAWAANRKGK